MAWETTEAPPGLAPPRPITVRARSIPARHTFPEHAHRWSRVVYAISGVPRVAVEGRSFAISPEHAVWLPTELRHRAGTLPGAAFRSLWIADEAGQGLPGGPTVFGAPPLLKARIVEAAEIEGQGDRDGYAGRVTDLILDQLRRARPLPGALPWPRSEPLAALYEALYADPADPRGPEAWSRELGTSERTLARRFEAEAGMGLRSWRRRLRLFKAVELPGGGLGVTRTAAELGYGSTRAFVHAFRTGMGRSPRAQVRARATDRGVRAPPVAGGGPLWARPRRPLAPDAVRGPKVRSGSAADGRVRPNPPEHRRQTESLANPAPFLLRSKNGVGAPSPLPIRQAPAFRPFVRITQGRQGGGGVTKGRAAPGIAPRRLRRAAAARRAPAFCPKTAKAAQRRRGTPRSRRRARPRARSGRPRPWPRLLSGCGKSGGGGGRQSGRCRVSRRRPPPRAA